MKIAKNSYFKNEFSFIFSAYNTIQAMQFIKHPIKFFKKV